MLLEVNIAEESSKSGVVPNLVDAFLEEASVCSQVRFSGLMCMAPLSAGQTETHRHFAHMREIAERLSTAWSGTYTFDELSMGTSADYEIAVTEGATIVRVGSVLF